MKVPDFMVNADNVYRTEHYIIKQVMALQSNDDVSDMVSIDTFYNRNKQRDKEFEYLFANRTDINGKRMPCTMCSRKYFD